jgi:hypothetical protein
MERPPRPLEESGKWRTDLLAAIDDRKFFSWLVASSDSDQRGQIARIVRCWHKPTIPVLYLNSLSWSGATSAAFRSLVEPGPAAFGEGGWQ